MSQRGARATDFEERDYYPAPRRANMRFEEPDYRTSRVMTRSPPRRQEELDVRFRERESDRGISFLRDDARRSEPGQMVLRKRDVETWDVHRSPSPPRVREQRLVRRPRSESPQYRDHERERSRTRVVERERESVRSPSVVRRRSPSPVVRFVERRRSPSPPVREHIRTRIVEREKEKEPSPSPSPSPPPVIRGPTIEREVITHYTDVDHGVIRARPPSPRPHPHRERETDIDISLSKNRTEVDVDIRRSASRHRSRSRTREHRSYHDDEIILRDGMERLRIDDGRRSHRRSHSAAPIASPVDEEADFITGKIDSRGRMGEAWHGHTKDWTIVDVPPGTERVRMDGVGGASTETNWSKYSGVRRTTFIPERDGQLVTVPREPSPRPAPAPVVGRDHTSVTVYDREREIDVDVDIDRRLGKSKPAPPPTRDMWTEITKDLVCREALEQMGYLYEETKWFFYIMEYLQYDEVLQLTQLTERIRRHRRHYREMEWERDYRDDWHHRYRRHHRPYYEWDDERVREREVIYDNRGPARGYFR